MERFPEHSRLVGAAKDLVRNAGTPQRNISNHVSSRNNPRRHIKKAGPFDPANALGEPLDFFLIRYPLSISRIKPLLQIFNALIESVN